MERLTTQLEDGSIERLRELAGGQRKVGAYLSQVVAWLWAHKEQLGAAPLSNYTLILQQDAYVSMPPDTIENIERRLGTLEEYFASLTEEQLNAMHESARQEDLKDIELMYNMLTDEEVEEYLATKDYGEYLAGRIAELSDEEIAELKANGRRKSRRKVKANATEQTQK